MGTKNGRVARSLVFAAITNVEGAPSWRSLQAWEPSAFDLSGIVSVIKILQPLRVRMIVLEKKFVKRIVALALMIGTFCGIAMSQQAGEFSSYYSGNRYDFRLTHKQLLNTPAWLDDEPNPPVSPRTAQNAALSYLKKSADIGFKECPRLCIFVK
jgi:hypothetical protein